jgi:hypothetical protein
MHREKKEKIFNFYRLTHAEAGQIVIYPVTIR